MNNDTQTKRLYLSDNDSKIAGVCGGIAEYFGKDSVIVRLLFILLALLTAVIPMVVFYLLAWLVMPRKLEEKGSL